MRGPPAETSIAWRFSGHSRKVTPLTFVFPKNTWLDTPLSSFPLPFVCPYLCISRLLFHFIFLSFFHIEEFLPSSSTVCSEKTLRQKLEDYYGDDVIITSQHGKKAVACFRDTGYKILNSSWYTQKSLDPEEERLRVVRTAAAIIRKDIRSMAYQTDEYEPPYSAFDNAMSVVPDSLKVFLDDVINK